MEALIGWIVMLYIAYSFVSALFKRAAQEPVPGEYGEEETVSPYGPIPELETVQAPEEWKIELMPPVADDLDGDLVAERFTGAADRDEEDRAASLVPVGPALDASAVRSVSRPKTVPRTTIQQFLSTADGRRQAMLLKEVLDPPRALRPYNIRRL